MKIYQLQMPSIFFSGLMVIGSIINSSNSPAQVGGNKNDNGRNDNWGMVGYGGGGAMFYPAVSPHNPDYAFVSCDMGGGYVTYD